MHASLPEGPHGFVLARVARERGLDAALRAQVADGSLERVRVGVYRRAERRPAYARQRYAEIVRAAALSLAAPVFTAYSAAAVLGLPILAQTWPREVFLLSSARTGRRRTGVIEVGNLGCSECVEVGGIVITSVELTLIQLARIAPLADALTAMDAALRRPRRTKDRPALTTIDRVRALHERLLPYRGSSKVEAVLGRATDSSDSPLETGSRLLFEEQGFEAPALQHPIPLPELGFTALLDFHWRSVDAGAEADGRGKYLSASTEASAATVIREKDRENAVRRRLRAFDRWDWNEFRAVRPVVERLIALGVPRRRGYGR
ncbi:hypothetical protein FLP10_06570 [Agromyces intestinalis]|uniref:Type IV toxin-antitoxin system AbiEi family antitoxin domain-containing protein n=1 Tax=Agromyces intestinalis TaxID=2592652 RepID=A0A5C1YDF4_9MICO|nr:hypothetical protein [Agromyces intestinalis]QEO14121.1 hypothetical protein FLP10_06570 [Agromyces intestinalis]